MQKINILIFFFLLSSCSSHHYIITKNESNKVTPDPILIVSTARAKENDKREIHLVSNSGDIIRKWTVHFTPLNAKLGKEGNLYVSGTKYLKENLTDGMTSFFQIIGKKNNVIWEYSNDSIHHDFHILPNGNISFLSYYSVKPPKALQKEGYYQGKLWPDQIIEVSPKTNEIVWTWKTLDHIDVKSLDPLSSRGDLFHMNSIDYTHNYYKTNKPAYIISSRTISTVFIVDKESGKILWKSPKRLFFYQHDASFLSDSRILVFNNSQMVSEVKEYDVEEEKVVWNYNGGENLFENVQFYSSVISGAQRLENGNTLVTLGTRGYVLEVTPNKKVVWGMLNSYNQPSATASWPFESLFKAKRVKVD